MGTVPYAGILLDSVASRQAGRICIFGPSIVVTLPTRTSYNVSRINSR